MSKDEVYAEVVKRLLEIMRQGAVPWKANWSRQCPMNMFSKRPYRGMNTLLLSASPCPYFMTQKQIEKKKGKILDGEKPYIITWWHIWTTKELVNGEERLKNIPLLRIHEVWNMDQTTLDFKPGDYPENQPIKKADAIMAGYADPPIVEHGAYDPCYIPALDKIQIPPLNQFKTSDDYYGALFHEAIHSTGHKTRLGRYEEGWGIDDQYSREELVAEIGASYLRTMSGIISEVQEENSGAYLRSWYGRLKENPKELEYAVKASWKAAKRILGEVYEQQQP